MTKVVLGTLSCGTMRSADLIPTFVAELHRLGSGHAALAAIEERMEQPGYYESEEAGWDLEWLFTDLDGFSPEGYYFGAHPGDGADYGFWEIWEGDQ